MRIRYLLLAALIACGPKSKPDPIGPITTGPPPPPAVSAPAPEPDTLPLWPRVKRGTLPNGLTYYVLAHKKPEKRAFLWLAVNAGSTQEDDDQRGLAHFVEHMAFNGTTRFPKQDIIKFLESMGMKFGAHVNAYTSFDETVYQLRVPTDEKAHISRGFDVLRDWAGGVAFSPAEIEKERGVVLEEWRSGLGVFERVRDQMFKALFKGTRYANRLPIGLPETLKSAPRAALVRYYQDWYRPDLMAVIAVGDFADTAAIEQEIAAKFGDLKSSKGRPRPGAGVPKADGTRVALFTDRELPLQFVTVFNVVPHRAETTRRDYRRIVAEQLFNSMLNERLRSIARRPDAPFSQASAQMQSETREIDAFERTAIAKSGKLEDALRSLFTEVLRVETHGFVASELERARAVLARTLDQLAVQEATADSSTFADEITRNFFEREFMIGGEAERELTLAALPAITLEELNVMAKSFGGADNRVIGIAGPDGKPLPTEQRVLAIAAEVAKAPLEPWQDKVASAPLMAKAPRAGKITKESKIDAIGTTEWRLSNGVRVIVKPTDFERDAIGISGFSPGGLAAAGAQLFPHARFADDVVQLGGVGELDAEDLAKSLASKRVEVVAAIDESFEWISGQGSARDLETLLQLVHLRMTAPRKDAQAIGVWKTNVAERLAEQQRMPEAQYGIQVQEALWKGHPRRRTPTPADIGKLDADKALAFYRDRFGDASDFLFVIVGEVDLGKLRPLVETYLASLPAKGRREKERSDGARRVGGVVEKTWALGQEQKAAVWMLFHGDEPWSREKAWDLDTLGDVLEIRLREVLREEMSGVYSVSAGGQLVRSPVAERDFSIRFGCAPDAVKPLTKAVTDEIAALAANGIGADYLEKVKQGYLREYETALRTNGFWIGWLERAARYGDDPTRVLDPKPRLARMTSDHVKAAARRFLDGKRVYRAILMPGKDAKPVAPPKAP